MCLPQNAKIADVQSSPYGYDVRLDDGMTGNVANDPDAKYWDEVQTFIGKSAPQSQGGPATAAPNTGKISMSQIGGDRNGQSGVRNISDTPDGGRMGIGTRTITGVDGGANTIDRAPATPGNIAQAAGNALGIATGGIGMAGTIGNMLGTQGQDIGQGGIAQAVDGFLNTGPAGGVKTAPSTSVTTAQSRLGGTIPSGGGGRQMEREERINSAQGRRIPGRMAELNRNIGAGFFGGGGGGGQGGGAGRSPGGSSRGARGE